MRWLALLFLACTSSAFAQWDVPTRVSLTAPTDGDRQVQGLADPLTGDAGVSAEAVRSNATTFATATGTMALLANLVPAPAAYTAGMLVNIVPAQVNSANATLDLNGLGPRPIVKGGSLPLDSADLIPGSPNRFIYDGASFQLIGPAYLPCLQGFHIGGREYCIEDSAHAALNFNNAMLDCVGRGGRLCSFAEWLHSCSNEAGFLSTVLDYEWVDSAGNDTYNAKRMGNGTNGISGSTDFGISCAHGSHSPNTNLTRYRCCMSR